MNGEKNEPGPVAAFTALRRGRGCLAPTPPATAPLFSLDAERRRALDAYVVTRDVAPAPRAQFDTLVAVHRCQQCHEVDGPARVTFPEVPPTLADTGNKLRTRWLAQVLADKRRVRPWLNLRMPHFGAENVRPMAPLFATIAGTVPGEGPPTPVPDQLTIREGVRSLGRGDEGLACITCHDFGQVISQNGIRGPDMITMSERIRGDWFRRWMLAPARIQPGTQMPTFFANVTPEVTERRIRHLWGALSMGPTLPRPEGLVDDQRYALTVAERPIVFRTFLVNASVLSLALGFPGGQSAAFDAETCRLQMAWSGEFLDVTPVWVGRGGSAAKPMGKIWYSEPPTAGLRIGAADRAPTPRFRSYTIEGGSVALSYDLDGVAVREKISPRSTGAGLVRSFSVAAGDGELYFLTRGLQGVRVETASGRLDDEGRLRIARGPDETKFTVTLSPEDPK